MAAQKRPRPISDRIGARRDGFMIHVSPEIVAERRNRRVSLFWALRERPCHDVLEVSAEVPPESLSRRDDASLAGSTSDTARKCSAREVSPAPVG